MRSELRHQLKKRAHALKPVVSTGYQGLTPALLNEIDLALNHHRLIKVRLNAADRHQRRQLAEAICQETAAELIQAVGHVITLYREPPDAGSAGIGRP
ncbi:ribosome assembly RNA-binding protein YhbY [Candidatus Methylocalor cossyra]|uniref:Ribosome assembly factor YhbY n=1 Tax=Candidatus Methylocalor cossyra TaxID=3108543 RepID=A0ABP1C4A5_9GAMM